MATLGFVSVLHLLTSTPVCELERPDGKGDWMAYRKGRPRPKGEGTISLSLSLSVYNIDSTKNGLYLGVFFHCLFFVFVNTPAVADNHHFLHEAYVSDDLVRAIHRFMKRYPKGIPVTDFTNKFEV